MKNKKKRPIDLANLGWTDFDFSERQWTAADVGIRPPVGNQVLPDVQIPTNPMDTLPQNYVSNGVNALNPAQVAIGAVTPIQQQGLQNYQADPKAFVNQKFAEQGMPYDKKKNVTSTILSMLTDINDESDNPIEYAYDNFLRGFGWVTDRINQLSVAAISRIPGGIGPVSWKQANKISFGQAAATTTAQISRKVAETGPVGAALAPIVIGTGVSPIGAAAEIISSLDQPEAVRQQTLRQLSDPYSQLYAKKGFDITDPIQRERAFEKSTAGKWTTGTADLAFTVFADPFIIGGKAFKLSRIRWVDRPVTSADDIARLQRELASDVVKQQSGQVDKMSSLGSFLAWATARDAEGNKLRSIGEVASHQVMREAADPDVLVSTIYNADNFEEAALIARVAYGDVSARAELMAKRADLAVEIGQARRRKIELQIAFDPTMRKKLVDTYRSRVDSARKTVKELEAAHKAGPLATGPEPPNLVRARHDLTREIDNLDAARRGSVPNPVSNPATKDELAFANKAVQTLMQRDNNLQKAIRGDIKNSLTQSTRGFGGESIIGRFVERGRQRRATAAWETAASRNAGVGMQGLRPWQRDEFFQTSGAVRLVRLWRWMGLETPSGFVFTKGAGAVDAGREVRAQLNAVRAYSGNGIEVVINGKKKIVGGQARKNQLLELYYATVGSGANDQAKMQKALMGMEAAVMRDIGLIYDVPKADIEKALADFNQARASLRDDILNRGYWVDKGSGDTLDINKAPWLEAHLENGMHLMDFGVAERVASQLKSGVVRKAVGATTQKLEVGYNAWNDIWRPFVLLRTGYISRNQIDALLRQISFFSSVAPMAYTAKQIGYGIRNPVVRETVKQEVKNIEKMIANPSTTAAKLGGTRFGKWRKDQLTAITDRIAKEQQEMDDIIDLIKVQTSREDIDQEYKNLYVVAGQIDRLKATKVLLMDDMAALSLYGRQSGAKRRVFDGYIDGPDSKVWANAFAEDSPYTPLALLNLSNDVTNKNLLSLKSDVTESLLRKTVTNRYVGVRIEQGDPYWAGLADQLISFQSSALGKMVLRGASQKRVAAFLRSDPEGRQIADMMTGGMSKQQMRASTFDEAEELAAEIIRRGSLLAPSPELRTFILAAPQVAGKEKAFLTGADVKRFLDNDQYRSMLPATIGTTVDQSLISKSGMDVIRSFTSKAFYHIGTQPEDWLSRSPFYGRRYKDTLVEIRAQLERQYPDRVPWGEINNAVAAAHKRALKDTRKWLFTIERRTNLGRYGEYVLPFISASQNTITTFGRLIYNDPSIPFILQKVWTAPDKAGFVDDEGNIRIPMPLSAIPSGLRGVLGLTGVQNFKVSKDWFNTIFADTGFGPVPTPGPLVGVSSSELMKRGWFGYSVETPEMLNNIFGKDVGDSIWTTWKQWVYGGEQGGLSAAPGSVDKLLPPIGSLLGQFILKENSSKYAYWYKGIYDSEFIKNNGNEPDPNFVLDQTNRFYGFRMLMQLFSPVNVQYDLVNQPLIDAARKIEEQAAANGEGETAQYKIYEMFGPILSVVAQTSVNKNVAGARASAQAVGRVRRYSNILQQSAPSMDDLSVLSAIINTSPGDLYDESAYNWQLSTEVPGVTEKFRERQTTQEAYAQARIRAGYTQYLAGKGQLDVLLAERGETSYRNAPDLNARRKWLIDQITNNDMYKGWREDFEVRGTQRVKDWVLLMTNAFNDPQFVEDLQNTKDEQFRTTMTAAYLYLQGRKELVALWEANGGGDLNSAKNAPIKARWDWFRSDLEQRYHGWRDHWNRWLSSDESFDLVSPAFSTLDSQGMEVAQ